ncbi:MAG TPA: FlgD immunoglobulin-like domain containing protein, partial [Fibrobacteria bacterium]|nr:FlgD immunoglobulin-like domain containing protein [Fibrobacteria bacterium]
LAFRAGGFSGGRTFVLDPGEVAGTTALTLAVHDVGGREIWSRTVAPARDGVRTVTWDGHRTAGGPAPAGVYLLRVKAVRDGKTVSLSERAVSIRSL